ncbi:MAG TPA: hypothetical protein VM425_20390 [Myxococcota bacterium]|nr:hypothetical protein [Myxococcota bacterium]
MKILAMLVRAAALVGLVVSMVGCAIYQPARGGLGQPCIGLADGGGACSGGLECQGGTCVEAATDGGVDGDDGGDASQDCATTADCSRPDYYCNQETHRCEAKGDCNPSDYPECIYQGGNDSIQKCDDESGMVVEIPCGQNKYCHDKYIVCLLDCANDADCEDLPNAQNPEPNSCNQGNNKCERVDLCPTYRVCGGSESCEGGACVLVPTTNAGSTGSGPDLQCFRNGAPRDNGSATECNLEGYVTRLIGSGSLRTADTIGLTVKAHSLADILAGDIASPLDTTIATDNGSLGYYQFTNALPTKQDLVLEVEAGGSGANEHVSLYLFGVYLRADACDAGSGTLDIDVPALKKSLYGTYTEGAGLVINSLRGSILARVIDCTNLDRVINATVGISQAAETTYYLVYQDLPGVWIPGTDATATEAIGFFGAANVTPIRGVVSALAKDISGMVSLGTYDIRVFPYSVSTLYFKKPLKPN